MHRTRTLLTNLELAIMREVWAAAPEPLTVREAADRLNRGRRRPLAYNTVQTMLAILREKGVVEARAGPGRAHCFRARVTRQQVTTSMVGDLIDRLFDGKVEPLLLQLVGGESLGRAELERLRLLIENQLRAGEAR